ncbi:ATP-binding cassette domain-containing protein [Actinocorallia populi]|uniref:ATP-binding cassette domain-containing protein n=1 Tax=Actinocorallia populi TaxID=2079200 RepID=UPI000D0866A0|nr:ABC transporter ATP-binding protein [Actinocorallia populi]
MEVTAVLAAREVWKRYRRSGSDVLKGVSLTVSPGELVSITGENGAGKSTLLSILAGETRPTKGSVTRPDRLGYCAQEPALYPRLTVDEHFALYAAAAGLDGAKVGTVRAGVLKTLDFERFAGVQTRALSGGTRAKLNLGLSLIGDPEVLILDEPYAAFDLASYEAFWALVDQQRDLGRAVVVVAHLELDARRFDQRLTLRDGVLHPEG